ncbi:MAG: hypothetical protein ABI789_07060 [Usitatibacter sp.]
MRTITLLSAAALTLGMAGCAQMERMWGGGGPPRKHVDKECHKNDCAIQVMVVACTSTGVSLNYPTVGINKLERNVLIVWTINDPNYEFTRNGIVINGGGDIFTGGGVSSNNKVFTVNDANPAYGEFKYTVNVKPKNSSTACPGHDPTIINGY